MGNSNSLHHQVISPQWVQSYPRPRHVTPQVKVLPERLPPLRLRTTDNGAILQNGGTISGRKQSITRDERAYRPRSSSAHRPPKPEDVTLDRTRYGSEPDLRFPKEAKEQLCENAIRQRISRSRKKYKAPPAPPNGSGVDSSSPDLNTWDPHVGDSAGTSARKVRLFKTRAESNKKSLSGHKKQERAEAETEAEESKASDEGKAKPRLKATADGADRRERSVDSKTALTRSFPREVISLKRNLATPEFQAELREAAQRLRPNPAHSYQLGDGSSSGAKQDSDKGKTGAQYYRQSRIEDNYRSTQSKAQADGNKEKRLRMGRDSESKKIEKTERDVPSKKFYFGMEENNNDVKIVNSHGSANNVDKTNAEHRITAVEKSKNLMNVFRSATADGRQDWEDSLEKFAATFQKAPVTSPNGNTTSCSSSFISDPDEDVDGGIALQLRPTLPKKQLEIPRFSPTAAWRLLSSIETHHPTASSPACSDEGPVLLEERISGPLSQQALRNSHDKSGDSGISGDASPGGCHESFSEVAPKTVQSPKNLIMAWTPQQDLEEESSSDDLESPLSSPKNVTSNVPGAKFSPRGQLFASREQAFSLSLPRDESLGHYLETEELKGRSIGSEHLSRFNSLKKLKAALASSKRGSALDEPSLNQDGNWVLSRSVPSSLNNSGHAAAIRSVSNPSSPDQDDDFIQPGLSLKYPSYSYLASGGRMMYLPEYHSRLSPDTGKVHNNIRTGTNLSKSCENISSTEMRQIRRTPSPVVSQNTEERYNIDSNSHKKKKFTFQSTIRLIENKKLAERLSREAEMKENQRLSELEAMKKVEEEFQKKRAREKANIRQQLRLFSMEEKNCSSLPPIDWSSSCRVEPDGAPSSLPAATSSSTASHAPRKLSAPRKSSGLSENPVKYAPITQVLSEYREPMRDYRDYRISRYHDVQDQGSDSNKRSVVEHPRVVYDMPKNTPVYVSAHLAQNQSIEGEARGTGTPRSSSSDNYRKDFAHGAVAAGGRSLASSDSELSQCHNPPTSRQGIMSQQNIPSGQRSRSASPESSRSLSPDPNHFSTSSSSSALRSSSVSPSKITSDERSRSRTPERVFPWGHIEEKERASVPQKGPDLAKRNHRSSPNMLKESNSDAPAVNSGARGVNHPNKESHPIGINELPRIGLSSLQPFKKTEKSFRPISFNPMNNKLAQPVN